MYLVLIKLFSYIKISSRKMKEKNTKERENEILKYFFHYFP